MATTRSPAAPTIEGRVITTDSGIVLPARAARVGRSSPRKKLAHLLNTAATDINSTFKRGYCYGYQLERDECDLIVRWPAKGSGIDDALSAAIVDGELANAGIAPTIMPQLSALVKRQELQARTAEIALTGRKTPVGNAQDALARANDSPLGSSQFVGQVAYQLRTFNRGAPMATVPITYPTGLWQGEGLTAVPIGDNYYLEVDWSKRGAAIPFLPEVWDLWPSGNPTWPYWYRTIIDERQAWVLLHCSQVLSITPSSALYGRNNATVGTSTVYLLWSILADHILKVDAHTEQIINRVTDGILAISGVDLTPADIKDDISAERATDDIDLMHNFSVLTSEDPIGIESFSFRKDVREWEVWREYAEDVIALAFDEPLQAVVQRGGLSVHQSEAAAENAADAGVNSVLSTIGYALGAIYPRLQVAVARQNDAAQRLNIETFRTFSEAIRALPEGTFTAEEVRAMIDRDILEIPQTGEDVVTDSANQDSDDPVANGQLAQWVHDAYTLETVDDVLASDVLGDFVELVLSGIRGSYNSVDIQSLMDAVNDSDIEPDDIDAIAQLIADENRMDPASDHTDLGVALTLLLAVAVMGVNAAEENAIDEDQDGYTDAQRDDAIQQSTTYLEQRIDELYVAASGGATNDIDDPRLDSTLDDTSRSEVARATSAAIEADDAALAEPLLDGSAARRGDVIGENESLRSHGNGHLTGAIILGALTKTWHITTAENPRVEHLATVGETVPINSRFSNGDSFSGERIGCQCSISVGW